MVEALEPDSLRCVSVRIICFLPCSALGSLCSGPAMHLSLLTLNFRHPTWNSIRMTLESAEDIPNYKNSPGPSGIEGASLCAESKIYLTASLKLFVLFYSESRERLVGTVKYALAHFS